MTSAAAREDIFRAVADPTRRAMLDLLGESERSVTELARPFRMSQPAISQHLRILREAGLVRGRQSGRRRLYRINPQQLRGVYDWAAKRFADPFGQVWTFASAGTKSRPGGRKVLPFPAKPREDPGIVRAEAVGVPVRDQRKALLFYTATLGFEVRRDEPPGELARWIEVAPPGAETTLLLVAAAAPDFERGASLFPIAVFTCRDVERAYRELSRRGVAFLSKPARQRRGGMAAALRDPDGNRFVLAQDEPNK
jgi:DNA-binding transcriptional ArsR family regulator